MMKSEAGPVEWISPPRECALSTGEIHVWSIGPSLTADLESLRQHLSKDELERASRFHFPADRDLFILRRGAMRVILAQYLKSPPDQLPFTFTRHGKPELANALGEGRVQFNLTHAQDLALLAIALDQPLGIDIEYINARRADERVAKHFFAAGEIESLKTLAGDAWVAGFFNCWTRKEAFVKAIGEGLSHPLDQFEVSLLPGHAPALLACMQDLQEVSRWSMRAFEPEPGYVGALVLLGEIKSVQFCKF